MNLRSRKVQWWGLGIGSFAVLLAVTLVVVWGPWRQAYLEQQRLESERSAMPPMSQYVPDTVDGQRNVAYGSEQRETLDVWYPRGTPAGTRLPVIVWVHGGGWIGGSKDDIAPYIQILASKGFATVGLNYSLAPAARYPTQIRQLNTALGYLTQHADELHLDPDRIVLAGDSGGAHIAAQTAAGLTDPAVARQLGLVPSVRPDQVAGLLLACGAFDLRALADDVGGVVTDYVEAYVGTTLLTSSLTKASVASGVTGRFPPTWLSAGNADPLTPQIEEFAKLLTTRGVDVEKVFWPDDHTPALGHEYQFNLALVESTATLDSAVAFAKKRTSSTSR